MLYRNDLRIRTALDVVKNPGQFSDQPALRATAWRTLCKARGSAFHPDRLPHIIPPKPAGAPAVPQSLAAALAESEPARLARIHAAMRKHRISAHRPTGGDAA